MLPADIHHKDGNRDANQCEDRENHENSASVTVAVPGQRHSFEWSHHLTRQKIIDREPGKARSLAKVWMADAPNVSRSLARGSLHRLIRPWGHLGINGHGKPKLLDIPEPDHLRPEARLRYTKVRPSSTKDDDGCRRP